MLTANITSKCNSTEPINVPAQLMDTHLRVVKALGKAPCEREWQMRNNYRADRDIIRSILKSGYNYGFTCASGLACFIDADFKEIQDALDHFTLTFRYSSGRLGHYQYVYFIDDEPLHENIPLVQGAYVKTKGGFVVGPGSIHLETGRTYGLEIRDIPIAIVKKADLMKVLQPFRKRLQPKSTNKAQPHQQPVLGTLRLEDMINLSGFRQSGSRFQGSHPIHGSESGTNFTVDVVNNQWHCFRCDSGGGPLQWVAVCEGIISSPEETIDLNRNSLPI